MAVKYSIAYRAKIIRMDYDTLLKNASNILMENNISSARLDALLLLSNATLKDKPYILAHPEEIIKPNEQKIFEQKLSQRSSGVPIAYILGKKEFCGRKFAVTKDVLIPRPDSETIIELLKKYVRLNENETARVVPLRLDQSYKLLDVGTGSGCLAITAKLELPHLDVFACDISYTALEVAKNNSIKLGADVTFFESDLLTNASNKYDYILANLPYVPIKFDVSPDVKFEPSLALYSGIDGLDIIKELFTQLPNKLNIGGLVFLESLISQHKAVQAIAEKQHYLLIDTEGLVQVYNKV